MLPFFFQAGPHDFEDAKLAIEYTECYGRGTVILFHREPNMHGGTDARSRALWKYENGKWSQWTIFSGTSEYLNDSKPHL